MKKLIGVLALLLILALFLICRQLISRHSAAAPRKAFVPPAIEETLALGSLFIQ